MSIYLPQSQIEIRLTPKGQDKPLKSLVKDNHSSVARNLVHILANTIEENDELGGKKVADAVRLMRTVLWPSPKKNPGKLVSDGLGERELTPAQQKEAFQVILSRLDEREKHLLIENVARMGHLHEMAGLVSRENYFNAIRFKRETQGKMQNPSKRLRMDDMGLKEHQLECLPNKIPGGIAEWMEQQPSFEEALSKLNGPIFESVFTAHPTNTNSRTSMHAQRQLMKALEENGNVIAAVEAFAREPLTKRDAQGRNVNFTVRDETETMLDYLGYVYEDLPKIYRGFDDELSKKAGQDAVYDPLKLQLNMRFKAWGSGGDKDGNDNVHAEDTLEAIALHLAKAADCYLADLEKLPKNHIKDGLIAEFNLMKTALSGENGLLERIGALRARANDLRGNSNDPATAQELSDEFDKLSQELSQLRKPGDAIRLENDLIGLLPQYEGDDEKQKEGRQNIVNLVRKLRTFGLGMGKIEYRETAEEYDRVAGLLLEDKNYGSLDPAQKRTLLEETLQSGQAEKLLQGKLAEIVRLGALAPYVNPETKEREAAPIAYHTLKRMQLARDFPDMIEDNVLAECGKLPDQLHPDTLSQEELRRLVPEQGAVNMLEALLMQKAAGANKDGKMAMLGVVPLFEEPSTMQRVGDIMDKIFSLPVYTDHLKALKEQRHLDRITQETQIAHSDNARRASLLAARASIHQAHDDISAAGNKHGIAIRFFEGGSMSDTYRNGVRALSAMVNELGLYDFTKVTFQGGDLLNYFSSPAAVARLMARNFTHAADHFVRDGDAFRVMNKDELAVRTKQKNVVIDETAERVVAAAARATLDDYTDEDFRQDKLGVILGLMNYNAERDAGNAGSRAGSRKAVGAGPVDVENGTRTIPFSVVPQLRRLHMAPVGTQGLEKHLIDAIAALPVDDRTKDFKTVFEDIAPGKDVPEHLNREQLRYLYEHAPAFKDAIDRIATAHAYHDPQIFGWLSERLSQHPELNLPGTQEYLASFQKGYEHSGKMALRALPEPQDDANAPRRKPKQELNDAQQLREDILRTQTARSEIGRKCAMLDFMNWVKDTQPVAMDDAVMRILSNMGNTAVHGRMVRASDPKYGASYLAYTDSCREKSASPAVQGRGGMGY